MSSLLEDEEPSERSQGVVELDYESVECAEQAIDQFIAQQAKKNKADRRRVEMWQESVKEYNRKRAEEQRALWVQFHREQIERHRATFDVLIGRHEKQLAALLAEEEEV